MSKRRDPYRAGNAVRKMDALADLIRDRQITERDGARRIQKAFLEFCDAIAAESPVTDEEMARLTYALGVGLTAAVRSLEKRGPVMVRYIDGEALITLLMPDGPPRGAGG